MKIIDISQPINESTPVYPGDCGISISKSKVIPRDSCNIGVLKMGLHAGTHLDAPEHMLKNGCHIADVAPENFIGHGVLLDVRSQDTIKMNTDFEKAVTQSAVVLLFTGFDKFYNEDKYFTKYPKLDTNFVEFLICKKIKMLGMDSPSPDYSPYLAHKALLNNGICILENLTNLQSLIGVDKFDVAAFPLKIAAEASPVRAVCIT